MLEMRFRAKRGWLRWRPAAMADGSGKWASRRRDTAIDTQAGGGYRPAPVFISLLLAGRRIRMPRRSNSITGYMARALEHLSKLPEGSPILDLPAGHGQLTDALRARGYAVTPADINDHRPDYVHADMTQPLPFASDSFAGVVCLEGVEHLLDPFALLGELIRVARPGGRVVISTPNISNMYSRLQFLFTGTLYQFHPAQLREVAPGEIADRFHIAPQSYFDLRYRAQHFGARVVAVDGDKIKRRALLPLYLAIAWLGTWWSRQLFFAPKYAANRARNEELYQHLNSWPARYSRSLILVFEKQQPTAGGRQAAAA